MKIYFKIIPAALLLFLTANILTAGDARAVGVEVTGPGIEANQKSAETGRKTDNQKKDSWTTAAARAAAAALKNVLNTLAYDTATWIGSGSKGQKPMFVTEGWDKYLSNVADDAAGKFIEELGKSTPWGKFNLCEPNFDVKLKIGLGLKAQQRPTAPACNFTKMVGNWKTAAQKLQDMKSSDYLKKASEMFEPSSNDVGAALTLQTGMMEQMEWNAKVKDKERTVNQGWLDVRNISGNSKTPPKEAEKQTDQQRQSFSAQFSKYSGDAFVDAANIFLNQLAITAFNRLMQKIGDNAQESTSPYVGDWGNLEKSEAAPDNGGVAAVSEAANKLMRPNFTTRADYDILAELSICMDPSKSGPSNCVITDKLMQAITERKTVGEAMKAGYLKASGIFGFDSYGFEPKYADEDYPYRSMLILRKYRIIPIGWEVGAQYVKKFLAVDNVNKSVSLGDMVACFEQHDSYEGYYQEWCKGLVDPTWVLKAPMNYCRRQGPGPELRSNTVVGEGQDSYVAVTRNDNYCADEQSCILENDDGSCSAYGYCTKERRKWDFGAESCDAKYNTCQTFRTEDGKTLSYLENTLNYNGCSMSNAGCKAYAADYAYDSQTWDDAGAKIYLDQDAEKCDQKNEGCHEFIRTRDGAAANLLKNSSFEDTDLAGTIGEGAGVQENKGYGGQKSLRLSVSGNLAKDIAVGPDDYEVGGERFALSFYSNSCGTNGNFGINGETLPLISSPDGWTRHQTVYIYPESASANKVNISINTGLASCLIDDIKLERGGQVTNYSGYGENSTVYEKLLPDYLSNGTAKNNLCYDANGKLKAAAPAECGNFVRKCDVDEVNCELYTSLTDEVSVPAKVVAQDYCASECVGFDAYVQDETTFDTSRSEYFIPSSAKICSAEAVGCDQFTNLDAVTKGGEATEYYSYLKQCIKPDPDNCSEYYSWEGSDEAGYQLKVMQLKKDAAGNPAVTENDGLECNESIYNLQSSNKSYNADCRQFYNKSGAISYHLISHTITCSDNCLPYRMTRKNVDPNISSALSCAGADRHWDGATEQCIVCKSGGTWDSEQAACVYQAIPDEGAVCAAEVDGCREYGGNSGNNMRVIIQNDFEGSLQDWTAVSGSAIDLSNESLIVGGHSMSAANSASISVGSRVMKGKSYVLSFIAKGKIPGVNVSAGIATSTASNFTGSAALFQSEWKRYELNLPLLREESSDSLKLNISGTGAFFIDDLKLTEITDRYYLIRDSWITPDSCNRDENGNPHPLFALGCDAYEDRDKNVNFLHSFSHLCQDSAVGCELLIDTRNSSEYGSKTVSSVNPNVTVPGDDYIYAVFDRKKQCSAIDKGCQRFGKPYKYEGDSLYSDVYLKNDPDKYSSILCDSSAVDCASWSTGEGAAYFRDPGDQVCEWRMHAATSQSDQGGFGWYKKKVKKCGGLKNEDVCLSDKDCSHYTASSTQICKAETEDIACPTSAYKTFGKGGYKILQPTSDSLGNWVGSCPAAESGCSEYIDPVSKFNTDLVVGSNVQLRANTLYVFTDNASASNCKNKDGSAVAGSASSLFYKISADNAAPSSGAVNVTGNKALVYVRDNSQDVVCTAGGSIRKASVEYQIKDSIDTKTCNGMADFENGCILFDERTVNGASGMAGLSYDAFATLNNDSSSAGAFPLPGSTANKLVKVDPDRECDEWLACEEPLKKADGTMTGVCKKVGICNKFDDRGACERFVPQGAAQTQDFTNLAATTINLATISNMSGYAKAAYSGSDINMADPIHPHPDNYYQFVKMSEKGVIGNISNSGFELYKLSSQTPKTADGAIDISKRLFIPSFGWQCQTENNQCLKQMTVLNNPVEIQKENVCFRKDNANNCSIYAPEGKSILRVMTSYNYTPNVRTKTGEEASVRGGATYVITGYVNAMKMAKGNINVQVEELRADNSQVVGEETQYVYTSVKTDDIYNLSYTDKGWKFFSKEFTTHAEAENIRIWLKAQNSPEGSFYVDDIKIRPVLESGSSWTTQQNCRLYPATDSLSCDYFDKSGVRYKGYYGYCLEYDRFPGFDDACLQWRPVPNNSNNVNESSDLNEICGDGQANGNEDCDCTNKQQFCEQGNNGYPSPAGTTGHNQYSCTSCAWTGGWCGNNQLDYGEHCDWNEDNPDTTPYLNGHNCQSGDYDEYKHNEYFKDGGAGYDKFLYLDKTGGKTQIGCFDNGGKDNYSGPPDLGMEDRCTFNLANCSDCLGTTGHCDNTKNTRKDCVDKGGVVVDKEGDAFGSASFAYENPPYFCKFTGGWGWQDLNNICDDYGMQKYGNWSSTVYSECATPGCGGLLGVIVNPAGQIKDAFSNDSGCGTGYHDWSNKAPESCAASRSCTWPASNTHCSAFTWITAVGCY